MQIEFMRIENWRSFYGLNEISFSTDKDKNVTLIRAENGVGKTSLLAALNWCLFGILPSENDFQKPKSLVNDQARSSQGANKTKVEIEFEHSGRNFKASRSYDQSTERTNGLRLVELKDGVETPMSASTNVDRFINSVIPREMAPHFFFYGEATSRYADATGAEAFGAAVKNILGATIANLALKDLEKVFKEYKKEAADNTSSEATDLEEQISKIEEAREPLEQSLKKSVIEEQRAEELFDKLNKQLLGTAQVKSDQEQRVKINAQLETLRRKLDTEERQSKKWFDHFGTPLLAETFINDVQTLLEQEDTKKKIPGPFNEKFVNEVLEDSICICGRPIDGASKEEAYIKSLLDTATDETMMNRVLTTNVALGRLREQGKSGWTKLKSSKMLRAELQDQISASEASLEEISQRLLSSNIESIAEKEAALKRAKATARTEVTKQGTIKSTIDNNERRIESLKRDQERLFRESIAARRFVKRSQLAGELTSRLSYRLEEEELVARIEIKRKVDDIIKAFMRKQLTVEIDKNYRLKVKDENGNIAANSTGEKQMLGLAFTGAITAFAKDREAEESDILLSGTEAPLVVDSPFGHLDPHYRKGVANFLPKMASQVVLLLSTSQASSEVLEELGDKIGNQYILTRFEAAPAGDRAEETVVINGQTKTLTKYDHDFTGTQIIEVM